MTTFTDNFNRADSSSLGSPWSAAPASGRIVSNLAALSTTGGYSNYDTISTSFTADQYAQCIVRANTGASGNPCVIVRADTGIGNMYKLTFNPDPYASDHYAIVKRASYSESNLATVPNPSMGTSLFNTDVTLRLEVSGTTNTLLNAYVNGSLVMTYTDSSSPITSGRVGIGHNNNSNGGTVFNDFDGGDFSSVVTRYFAISSVGAASTALTFFKKKFASLNATQAAAASIAFFKTRFFSTNAAQAGVGSFSALRKLILSISGTGAGPTAVSFFKKKFFSIGVTGQSTASIALFAKRFFMIFTNGTTSSLVSMFKLGVGFSISATQAGLASANLLRTRVLLKLSGVGAGTSSFLALRKRLLAINAAQAGVGSFSALIKRFFQVSISGVGSTSVSFSLKKFFSLLANQAGSASAILDTYVAKLFFKINATQVGSTSIGFFRKIRTGAIGIFNHGSGSASFGAKVLRKSFFKVDSAVHGLASVFFGSNACQVDIIAPGTLLSGSVQARVRFRIPQETVVCNKIVVEVIRPNGTSVSVTSPDAKLTRAAGVDWVWTDNVANFTVGSGTYYIKATSLSGASGSATQVLGYI